MKRFVTGAILLVALLGAFLLREVNLYLFDICVGVFTLFAALEISKLLTRDKKHNLVLPMLIYTSIAYLFLLIAINNSIGLGIIFIGLVLALLVVFIAVFAYNYFDKDRTKVKIEYDGLKLSIKEYSFKSAISTTFNCIYPTLLLLLFIVINHFDSFTNDLSKLNTLTNVNLGLIILLTTIVTSVFSDVFAYFVGGLIGGKKLCPNISANKTISGAIGAVCGSVLAGVALFIILSTNNYIANAFESINLTLLGFIFISIFASIFTQLGDLFESILKRKAKVKDSGNVLPGHGGLMDRVDGLSFNTLFIFIVFLVLVI